MIALAANGLVSVQGWTAGLADLSDLSRVATGSLVAAVWQGILLAAAAALGLRLLPKTPAAVRFAIWFAVFLLVTVLPVLSLLPHAAKVAPASGHAAWLTLDERWSIGIAAVWLLASLVRAGTLMVAALRVRALWNRATPLEIDTVNGLHPTHRDATAMNGAPARWWADRIYQRDAQICTSDEVDRPTVIGFFSPKILIPGWLLHKLTSAELEQIVLHEAGHLGRADDWMNLLQKVALVVFPLNPALAWVERRLCFERELACDERVLHATGAPRAYAACLATLAEYRLGRRGLTLALGALGRESELGQRVGRILRRGEIMKPAHAKFLLGGAMVGLLGAAVGLAHCPQVVGFSSVPEPHAAVQTPAPMGAGLPTGYGYQAAVLRASTVRTRQGEHTAQSPGQVHMSLNNSDIRQQPEVPHEILLKATLPSSHETASLESAGDSRQPPAQFTGKPVQMVRTGAFRPRARSNSVSDVEPSRPADGVMQWVVVSSWSDADGDRMVLATAISNGTLGRAAETRTPASQQVHPYAAVPVRDGWLVFQL